MSSVPPFNPHKSSRKLDDLILPAKMRALEFIHACRMAGIEILVTCTYRCPLDQDKLFAQGRTAPGRIVTNARAGQSMHQYRVALDIVPMRNGKPVWGLNGNGIDDNPTDDATDDLELWQRVGILGEQAGLDWAGRWANFREFPHFQYTGGLMLSDLRSGKVPV